MPASEFELVAFDYIISYLVFLQISDAQLKRNNSICLASVYCITTSKEQSNKFLLAESFV